LNCFDIFTAHPILLRHHFLDNLILNFDQIEVIDLVLKKEDRSSISEAKVVELHAIVITVQKAELSS
jgi:hypothetical protein